jgi:5-methyltetrahydropteroyltriglutamate--homocysteine methyltransferase
MERFVMALSHTLGFLRIGRDRQLKKALEAYRQGELNEVGLQAVGRELRARHWQLQKEAGIQLLPIGNFAWYDQVLTHSLSRAVHCGRALVG